MTATEYLTNMKMKNLKTALYNAIVVLEETYDSQKVRELINITEEEYKEIME